MTEAHLENEAQLRRMFGSEIGNRLFAVLLSEDLPMQSIRYGVLGRWRELNLAGRLLRREIEQLFVHFSRVDLAAQASLIAPMDARAFAQRGLIFLGAPDIHEYFAASRRLPALKRLHECLDRLTHAPSPERPDAVPQELCAEVFSLDEVIRTSSSIRALGSHVEDMALAEDRDKERQLSDLCDLVAREAKNLLTGRRPQPRWWPGRSARLVLSVFELISLLGDFSRVLRRGHELEIHQRLLDHYGYWSTFLGPLLHKLVARASETFVDAAPELTRIGLPPAEVLATTSQIDDLAKEVLLANQIVEPEAPTPLSAYA